MPEWQQVAAKHVDDEKMQVGVIEISGSNKDSLL
jgi:hypothetical protein